MSFRRNNRLGGLLLLALPLALAGCGSAADYLNHRDTITLRAGDAKAFNTAVQTVDPQATRADNTHIHTDGKYVSNVMDNYHARPAVLGGRAGPGAAAAGQGGTQ